MLRLLLQLIKKDVLIFASDRRAMIIQFLVPVSIASFLSPLMSATNSPQVSSKIPVLIVDEDGSPATKAAIQHIEKDNGLSATVVGRQEADKETKEGKVCLAAVFPKGFGDAAVLAMTQGAPKPTLQCLIDPANRMEAMLVQGYVSRNSMQGVAVTAFPDTPATAGLPFEMSQHVQAAGKASEWSGSAHAFAGMGVQALFFAAVEAAMLMMRDRRNGIWSRLRASPISPWILILGRYLGSVCLSFLVYNIVIAVGALIFGFRITGSFLGYLCVTLSIGAMTAAVGLFIAALGKTEQQSRGLSILVILTMLMLGGAWIPPFILPKWIQSISFLTPVRWAVDGVDTVTWRGGSFSDVLPSVGVLLGFAVVLFLIAGSRFKWEPETK